MQKLIKSLLIILYVFAGNVIFSDAINNRIKSLISSRDFTSLEDLLDENHQKNVYENEKNFNPYLLYDAIKSNDLEVVDLLLKYKYPLSRSIGAKGGGPGDIYFFHWGLVFYHNNISIAHILIKHDIQLNLLIS